MWWGDAASEPTSAGHGILRRVTAFQAVGGRRGGLQPTGSRAFQAQPHALVPRKWREARAFPTKGPPFSPPPCEMWWGDAAPEPTSAGRGILRRVTACQAGGWPARWLPANRLQGLPGPAPRFCLAGKWREARAFQTKGPPFSAPGLLVHLLVHGVAATAGLHRGSRPPHHPSSALPISAAPLTSPHRCLTCQ
jgi:hypothetical protein